MMCLSKQPLWNAFDASAGSLPRASFENLPQKSEPLVPAQKPATSDNHHQYKNSSEVILLHDYACFQLKMLLICIFSKSRGLGFPICLLPG